MNTISSDYLEICSQLPPKELTKQERKRRHTLLTSWEKKAYDEPYPTFRELEDFWKQHGNYCLNPMFVRKIIVPIVQKDIEANGINGIRFLFQCFQGHENTYCYTNNMLYLFCKTLNFKYAPIQLANKLLQYEPDNEFALKYKYYKLKYYLEFSLHEMPIGILNGMDSANIDDIPRMLLSVDEFQSISDQLGMNDSALVNDCRTLYPAYKDYLQCHAQYDNFEDYLKKNNIPYNTYCDTYYYERKQSDETV